MSIEQSGLVAIKTLLELNAQANARVVIEMLDVLINQQPEQEPVAFLCNGTRFKMTFFENDQHLRMTIPHTDETPEQFVLGYVKRLEAQQAEPEPVAERERWREAFMAGYQAAEDDAAVCRLPPTGWHCTRKAGHEGPCAAVETDDAALVEQGMARLRESSTQQSAATLLEKESKARRAAQEEVATLKERLARARIDTIREMKEQGWVQQPADVVRDAERRRMCVQIEGARLKHPSCRTAAERAAHDAWEGALNRGVVMESRIDAAIASAKTTGDQP